MLEITQLPNEITDFDYLELEKIKSHPDITTMLYNEQMHYRVINHNKEDKTYEVTHPYVDINQTIDQCFQEHREVLPEDFFSIIPVDNMFEDFKNDLIITPVYHNEDLNIENPFIADFYGDLVDEEFVIYEPQTNVHLFYNPEDEHCFKVNHKEDTFYFDSLDVALKLVYESAMKKNYHTPFNRKMMKHLESEEGEKMLDDFIHELDDYSNKKREFVESGKYFEAINKLEDNMKLRNIESISSEDFYYLKDFVSFIDQEDFQMLVDISLEREGVTTDESNPFDNYGITVEGLHFHRMIGQGTINTISLSFEEEIA